MQINVRAECRICYEPYILISVCQCKGSVQYVCLSCFSKYYKNNTKCEICHKDMILNKINLNQKNKLIISVLFLSLLAFHIKFLKLFWINYLGITFLNIIVKYQEFYFFANILLFNFFLFLKIHCLITK